jgi:pSer/pThr/pTyr-binding forkhead associated (FHA) protein
VEAYLKFLSGSQSGQVIPISGKTLLIGREIDCHVRVDSEFVSRHHCAILRDDFGIRIRDLASRNGTFLNDKPVPLYDIALGPGDIIAIGDIKLEVFAVSHSTSPIGQSESNSDGVLPKTVETSGGETIIVDAPQPKLDPAAPQDVQPNG